tara:strand:- start:358 stop:513 length:156 start_codon:yes stop_codon:yes gene_type:complete
MIDGSTQLWDGICLNFKRLFFVPVELKLSEENAWFGIEFGIYNWVESESLV